MHTEADFHRIAAVGIKRVACKCRRPNGGGGREVEGMGKGMVERATVG